MFPKQLGFDGIRESVKYRSLLSEDRLNALYNSGLYCSNLDGDFVELGCHCGGASFLLALVVKPPHILHTFDSFQGFPKPTIEDKGGSALEGEYTADYNYTSNYLTQHNRAEFTYNKVKIYKGFIKDTLINLELERFSLIHFDMDLYEPTRFALHYLWDKVVSGGCVIFDDYLFDGTKGVKKAVDEFFPDLFKYNHWLIEPQLGVVRP
jgi:hypothetical protein